VNATLEPGGEISGTIADSRGHPLQEICVSATDTLTGAVSETIEFNSSGTYDLTGISPGGYRVEFTACGFDQNLAPQWYPDSPGEGKAATVVVKAGRTTAGIGAAMLPGGTLRGTVHNPQGVPLAGICVSAYTANYSFGSLGITSNKGTFSITSLETGIYVVAFTPCGFTSSSANYGAEAASHTFAVFAGKATNTGTEVLHLGGTLAGIVKASGHGVPGACVYAYNPSSSANPGGSAETSRSGRYKITGLAPGTYDVQFDADCFAGPGGYDEEWYQNQPTSATAMTVTVVAGSTTFGINANLVPTGAITGTVSGSGTKPLTGVCAEAISLASGEPTIVGVTARGSYVIGDLLAGSYKVEFVPACGVTGTYATQWYNGASSEKSATVVVVGSGATTTGIDAELAP